MGLGGAIYSSDVDTHEGCRRILADVTGNILLH